MSCIDLLGRTWSPPAGPAAPAASPPDQAKAPAPHLPDPPPLTGAPLTVDDAWQIFGVAQKRAPRADVKRRYLAFAAKWPGNGAARSFLESLARAGAGGFYQTGDEVDVAKQLPAVIAGLLNS